jgi:phosphatidate cytidylyltransferase
LLRWRILLGVGLIAALAGLMTLDHYVSAPGACLLVIALAAGGAAAQEFVSLATAPGRRPLAGVVYGGTLAVIASNAVPIFWRPDQDPLERLAWPLLAFVAGLLAALGGEMRRYERPGGVIVNLALTVLGIAYVGLCLSFAAQLRLLGGPVDGLVALAALIIVVKMGDTGAYAVGRLVGRHKMAPVLSPGKTWEGAAGAIVFGTLGAWLAFHQLPEAMGHTLAQHDWSWLVFGLAVTVTGMLGDLAESLLKRDAGRKDSSNWLPGFGGVLDILDSILLAAPVAWFCWWLGMY